MNLLVMGPIGGGWRELIDRLCSTNTCDNSAPVTGFVRENIHIWNDKKPESALCGLNVDYSQSIKISNWNVTKTPGYLEQVCPECKHHILTEWY